jgi:hypothetical protein
MSTVRFTGIAGRRSRGELEAEIAGLRESLGVLMRDRTSAVERARHLEARLRYLDHFIRHQLPAEVANPWKRICQARRAAHAAREETVALRAEVADLRRALAGRRPIAVGPAGRRPVDDAADTQPVMLGSAAWAAAGQPPAAGTAGVA